MENPRDTAQKGQHNVDPEGVVNLPIFHINSQRWNEKANNNLQNLVIHKTLSFSGWDELSFSLYINRKKTDKLTPILLAGK